jgi:hypothetical protein
MSPSPTARPQINLLKDNPRRTGTVISRTWHVAQDLGIIKIRPDGGNEDGSDDATSGPMLAWPESSKERDLAGCFKPGTRVMYEVEEGGGKKKAVGVRAGCEEEEGGAYEYF